VLVVDDEDSGVRSHVKAVDERWVSKRVNLTDVHLAVLSCAELLPFRLEPLTVGTVRGCECDHPSLLRHISYNLVEIIVIQRNHYAVNAGITW
jgi:hypothetical protein